MVLTKQEANQYRSGKNGGNISIAKLADTIVIREEADIEKVTSKLVSSIKWHNWEVYYSGNVA